MCISHFASKETVEAEICVKVGLASVSFHAIVNPLEGMQGILPNAPFCLD
jgi:hypothetical protein